MDVSKDYYKILGVNKNATKKEIRSSYLKMAKKWHPDLHKADKDKEAARIKFIEFQEAYEVLHDAGMRKKYDEMRRYGYTQDQFKQQEAYNKYRQQGGSTHARGASPFSNAWEDEFRRNMQQEWEKIRREQQDWASQRRSERHQYQHEFPFGAKQNMRGGGFGSTPFGFGPTGPKWGYDGPQPANPMGGFFRIMLNVFLFFMIFRLIGALLFGPREPRRRWDMESPFYDQTRHNPNFPPPYSLNDRMRRNRSRYGEPDDNESAYDSEYDKDRKLRRGRYVPPPPPPPGHAPRPRNSLKDPRDGRVRDDTLMDDDGTKYVFSKPSDQQTTDISSPEDQRRRMKNQKRSKYERMLEEQRMMEEVYIKARKKQMEEAEYQRQRQMNKRFGKRGTRGNVPPKGVDGDDADTEDVNTAWERYLNNNSGSESNWRDRGRKNN